MHEFILLFYLLADHYCNRRYCYSIIVKESVFHVYTNLPMPIIWDCEEKLFIPIGTAFQSGRKTFSSLTQAAFGRKNFSLLVVRGVLWEEKLFPPGRLWRALGGKAFPSLSFVACFGRKNFSLLDISGAWEEKLFPPCRWWWALS